MTKGWIGVLVGFLIGAAIGNFGGIIASAFMRGVKSAEVHKGWNSKPAFVVKRDLPAGAPITRSDLEERPFAEAFVSASLITRDSIHMVEGQRLRVPLKAGQPLEWSFISVAMLEQMPTREACAAAVSAKMGGAR